MRSMRVSLVLVLAGATTGLALSSVPVGVSAGAEVGPACADWRSAGTIALGSPGRAVNGIPRAGVVELKYREASGWVTARLSSSTVGVPEQPGGLFGASVDAYSISSGDYCQDLVVGMPGKDGGAGGVVVVPDFGSGLNPSAAVWLPAPAGLQPGDALGSALTVLPWEWSSPTGNFHAVVAGAPGRDVEGAPDAGMVVSWQLLRYSESPGIVRVNASATYTQGSAGLQGRAEAGDRFGSVLASWDEYAVVGIPDEDIETGGKNRKDAGSIAILHFTNGTLSGNDLLWQGAGLPGGSQKGDRLGAAVATRRGGPILTGAFGVPGKDADKRKDSGAVIAVTSRYDAPSGRHVSLYSVVTQNTRGVPDRSEKGDAFGASVSASEEGSPFTLPLAVGAPGENVGRKKDAGSVTYLSVNPSAPGGRMWSIAGLAARDRFGSSVRVRDYYCEPGSCRFVFVGAPGEDRPRARDAGRIYVMAFASAGGSPATSVLADGVSAKERLGR